MATEEGVDEEGTVLLLMVLLVVLLLLLLLLLFMPTMGALFALLMLPLVE